MKAAKWLGGLLAAVACFVSCDLGISYTAGTLGYRAGTGIQNGRSLVPVPERDQYRITQDMFFPESDVKVLLIYEDGKANYILLTDLEIRVSEGLEEWSDPVGDAGYSFPTLGHKKVGIWYEDLESYYWVTVYDQNAGGNNNGNNPDDGGGGTGSGLDWIWAHRP
jgi:hypothetical protein